MSDGIRSRSAPNTRTLRSMSRSVVSLGARSARRETAVGAGHIYDVGETFVLRVTNVSSEPVLVRAVVLGREASRVPSEVASSAT